MKKIVIVCSLLFACQAFAFDSALWLEKREILSREAERLMCAYTNYAAKVSEPAENVVVPVESFPDGAIKTLVQAKKAQYFLQEGFIWAENVVVKRFRSPGKLEFRIDARNCIIDRSTKSGWANGRAIIRHDGTVFYGDGIYFSSTEGFVSSYRDTRMEIGGIKSGSIKEAVR